MFTLTQTENAQQSAQKLAQNVAENLREVLAKQERATLAVSGGKSPIAFFNALNQMDLDWSRVNVALVDERVVPTHHADSNTQLVRENLLQNQAKAAQFLPMIDDVATAENLQNIENALQFARRNYVQPDVLILGMGGDGHTASLFPQAPQINDAISPSCPENLVHTTPITAPHERISMTLNAIEHTPHVYLAIAGDEKNQIFQQAKQKIMPEFPISYVLNSNKVNCHVIYNN